MIDAIAAGHLCIDIVPTIPAGVAASDAFMAPGRLTQVGAAVLSTGGSVSNTGLALYRLGTDVRLVARIGEDWIGALNRDLLRDRDERLTEHLRIVSGEPSAYTIVINPPGMDRTFLHCPGANDTFGPEDLSDDLLEQTRLLHFGYPPLMRRMYSEDGAPLTELLRRAQQAGATTSLDMAMPDPAAASGQADWRQILANALPHVDLFCPSIEELAYMLHRDRYEDLVRRAGAAIIDAIEPTLVAQLGQEVLDLGARVALIKVGHRGVYLRTSATERIQGRGAPADSAAWGARELWAPAFCVDVVGTVGAGDASIAGFLTGVLRGQGPVEALTSAVAVGACNVEAIDATSGVRPWEETQARIAAGWSRLDAGISDDGWRWDKALGIWRGPHDQGY
jgi:sugar/nucleoside kinase (ribokinase family)